VPAAAADDHDMTILSYFITELCEIRTSGRVSCVNCHKLIFLVKLYRHTVQIVNRSSQTLSPLVRCVNIVNVNYTKETFCDALS
jgi:hypothetical protein